MMRNDTKHSSPRFTALLEAARKSLRNARKNRHSLSGAGYYAGQFMERMNALHQAADRRAQELEIQGQPDHADALRSALVGLSAGTDSFGKAEAELNRVRTVWYTSAQKHLGSSAARIMEQTKYLPPELRNSIPPFFRSIFDQIQGCFAFQYWDAGLVMLRKLVEVLVIDGYENSERQAEITTNGNYLAFGDLVGKAKSGALFTLSRDSKSAIDEVKRLGDNAAHNPRFVARKSDVHGLRVGSRILVEDLVKNIHKISSADGSHARGEN